MGGERVQIDELGTVTALDAEPVPHATPLATGATGTGQTTGTGQPASDELNQQIAETLSELIRHAHDLGQGIAAEFGLTASDGKALIMLEAPMTMKELGLRMGCDPSFVTSVADALEKHGLARREPSQRDRRSKNIVLTPEGAQVRTKIFSQLMARAPWCTSLDTSERRCLLTLMRKMLRSRCGR
jgi:MarR family transcriptional regulator, organic hydroperoxide resistance regulator